MLKSSRPSGSGCSLQVCLLLKEHPRLFAVFTRAQALRGAKQGHAACVEALAFDANTGSVE